MKALAIHEASGQDITFCEVAFSLTSGGGKPGQGFPCVLIEVDNDSSSSGQSSKRQQSDSSCRWDSPGSDIPVWHRGGNVPMVMLIYERTDSFGIESESRNDN